MSLKKFGKKILATLNWQMGVNFFIKKISLRDVVRSVFDVKVQVLFLIFCWVLNLVPKNVYRLYVRFMIGTVIGCLHLAFLRWGLADEIKVLKETFKKRDAIE